VTSTSPKKRSGLKKGREQSAEFHYQTSETAPRSGEKGRMLPGPDKTKPPHLGFKLQNIVRPGAMTHSKILLDPSLKMGIEREG